MTLSEIKIIDTDSHVMEPPDLWTARLDGSKWGDMIPHVRRDDRAHEDRWQVGDQQIIGAATLSMAGWREFPPSHPRMIEDADPAAWDPGQRLKRLDDYGIYAQLLYPNLLGFFSNIFYELDDHELRGAIVRGYNDFLVDFCSEEPNRLIPLMWLPFWDVDESVREMERCESKGHRGIVFPGDFEPVGLPRLPDEHWYPVWEAAQSMELSVNFHIGFQPPEGALEKAHGPQASRADNAKETCLLIIDNASVVADLTLYGVCHRFPRLNFVSVESGFGWLPYFAELLDWQFLNTGLKDSCPHGYKLPSEFMHRQIYGSFWFEKDTVNSMVDKWQDSIFFETDFPHPTSLSPGPASYANSPRETIRQNLGTLQSDVAQKILHGNAARVYHLT